MTTARSAAEIARRTRLVDGVGVDAPDTGTVIEKGIARRDTRVTAAVAVAVEAVLDQGDTSADLIRGQKVERS